MSQFRYNMLLGKREIRILRLFSDRNRRARLQGELLHVNLDTRPVYVALSYVWGTESDPQPLICNGQKIRIGKNLGQALRHVRPESGDCLFIWVDALCINQRDIKEKNTQVAMMKEIYWFAEEVKVWLGLDDTGHAEEIFNDVGAAIGRMIDGVESKIELQEILQLHVRRSPEMMQQLVSLFHCEYFTRTWIIQEIGLAKRATAYWGQAITSFHNIGCAAMLVLQYPWTSTQRQELIRDVQRVVDVYRAYHPSSGRVELLHHKLQIARPNLAGDSRDKVYALLSHPGAVDHRRNEPSNEAVVVESRASDEVKMINLAIILAPDADEMATASVRYIENKEPAPPPLNHNSITAYRILKDQHNERTSKRRLYQINSFIRPDYSKSIVCIYREVVLASIDRTEALEILSYVQHPEELAPFGPDFPSWVPRWDKYTEVSVIGHTACDHFAAANRRVTIRPSPDYGTLVIKGIVCDRVALHTILLTRDDFTDFSKTSPIFSMSKHSKVDCHPVPPYPCLPAAPDSFNPIDTDRVKAYRKTWAAGRACTTTYNVTRDYFNPEADFAAYQIKGLEKESEQDTYSPENDDLVEYIERKRTWLLRTGELKAQAGNYGDAGCFAKTAAAVCHQRKFFITQNGFFGIGPAATEIGDAVHVLLGADVPFLLRQKNMCGRYEPDRSWSLVGEFYVSGLMTGETLRAVGKPSEELDDVILR